MGEEYDRIFDVILERALYGVDEYYRINEDRTITRIERPHPRECPMDDIEARLDEVANMADQRGGE